MKTMTVAEACELFGDASQISERMPKFEPRFRDAHKEAHRSTRRKVMGAAFRAGNSPDEIAEFMDCPRFVVLHNLRMYGYIFMDLEYGLTEHQLEKELRPEPETETAAT
jgi:hypothetical protein